MLTWCHVTANIIKFKFKLKWLVLLEKYGEQPGLYGKVIPKSKAGSKL